MYFVYGDGGTGKTTLFKQFPGRKLLLSFDISAGPLAGDKSIDAGVLVQTDIPVIQETVDAWVDRAINSHKYESLALDNVSSLQNLVLENIDNKAKDNRQNYQKLQLWFRELAMKLRTSGMNIYATAHQTDNGASGLTGGGRYAPDMNEKTFNAFTSVFDVVGRIYKKDKQRWIDLDPEQGNHAKNRIDERTLIKADELLEPKEHKEEKEGAA
ncbi:phage nucleotide-binding protein [Limosilactobacillus coleohominis DSM 14060]|nr:phage nucleotide-binding protein [Limosilactobacillus coleohominis DSM 14060]